MLHVLILVRALNLHVGPRRGVILDIFVDLNQLTVNGWKLKRIKQIQRQPNRCDGWSSLASASFSLITFLIELIYVPHTPRPAGY